jgi:hypothetical protein
MSKIKSNEEPIHLSSLLPSNIISELDENKNNSKTNLSSDSSNKENNMFQNQINFNSINCFSNQNNENVSDMEIETNKNDFSYSNRSSSFFSNLFQEENNKLKQNSPKKYENINSFNIPNKINNININKYQTLIDNYSFAFNSEDYNKMPLSDLNKNLFNMSGNKSRFISYFNMDENNQMPNNSFNNINNKINNTSNSNNINNISNNNIINISNRNIINNLSNNNNIQINNLKNNMNISINKNENYKYIYDNGIINLNNNNNSNLKFEFNSNNLTHISQHNLQYNDGQNSLTNIIDVNYINNNNINNININNNKYNTNINITNDGGFSNIVIPNNILNTNIDYEEFLNYVNNLNMPLIKFLCTKKGISEMENYLNNHKNNIEILIYLLNKEGLTKLMKHKFGNYFIQEIIKEAKYPQIKLILELISQNFVEISESNSGTHVLQALLDKVISFELRNIVLRSIENKELEMAFNNNATYVLQKIIGIIPDTERLNTNEVIINNTINLALDSDCVFIIEKFISTITIIENKRRIKKIICDNCIQLATSPFGNYLIQYLFQVWKDNDIEEINNIIIDNANFLAKQRYSSNVIEKAVDTYNNKYRPRLVRSLSLGGDILEIIKNQYGHYVLNKTVKFMDEGLKNEIETILNNKMPEMTKKEKTKSKKFIANLKKNGKNNKKGGKNTKK